MVSRSQNPLSVGDVGSHLEQQIDKQLKPLKAVDSLVDDVWYSIGKEVPRKQEMQKTDWALKES